MLKEEPRPGSCYTRVKRHTWPEKESMFQLESTQFVTPPCGTDWAKGSDDGQDHGLTRTTQLLSSIST